MHTSHVCIGYPEATPFLVFFHRVFWVDGFHRCIDNAFCNNGISCVLLCFRFSLFQLRDSKARPITWFVWIYLFFTYCLLPLPAAQVGGTSAMPKQRYSTRSPSYIAPLNTSNTLYLSFERPANKCEWDDRVRGKGWRKKRVSSKINLKYFFHLLTFTASF